MAQRATVSPATASRRGVVRPRGKAKPSSEVSARVPTSAATGHPPSGSTKGQKRSAVESLGPTVQQMQALLRQAGLRSTSPRLAVLEYMHSHRTPNSHAELFDALAIAGFDRATIYRVLVNLADVGILRRTDLGDHVWRFELRSGVGQAKHTDEHPHFVCVDCGEISCLPEVDLGLRGNVPKAVKNRDVVIQLRGVCDDCQ
jgi:Fur family transcriptional regulator, ferric uptake regulator